MTIDRNARPGQGPDADTRRQYEQGRSWLIARSAYLSELGRDPTPEDYLEAERRAYRSIRGASGSPA